jgi:hypothetical protein
MIFIEHFIQNNKFSGYQLELSKNSETECFMKFRR